MKKLVLSIVIIASLIGCSKTVDKDKLQQRSDGLVYEVNASEPFTGKAIEEIYGVQRTNESYINGKKEGECIYFHDNGKKAVVKTIKNGKLFGEYITWNREGQQEIEASFNENVYLPSRIKKWYDDGQKMCEVNIDPNAILTPVEITNYNGDKSELPYYVFGRFEKLISELLSTGPLDVQQFIEKFGKPSEIKKNLVSEETMLTVKGGLGIKERLSYNDLLILDDNMMDYTTNLCLDYYNSSNIHSEVRIRLSEKKDGAIKKELESLLGKFSGEKIGVLKSDYVNEYWLWRINKQWGVITWYKIASSGLEFVIQYAK